MILELIIFSKLKALERLCFSSAVLFKNSSRIFSYYLSIYSMLSDVDSVDNSSTLENNSFAYFPLKDFTFFF